MSLRFIYWFKRLFRTQPIPDDEKLRHLVLGKKGEKAALKRLQHEGYRIRALNYATKRGEIDIIAQERNVIAFVEVRTLSGGGHSDAFATLDKNKRRHLTLAARQYLNKFNLQEMDWRFDFISVIIGDDGIPRVNLIRDAFSPV